jgi:hypothetical protein
MDKYRIRCITEDLQVFVLSSNVPTACPNDSGHQISTESVCIVQPGVVVNDGSPKDLSLGEYKTLRFNEIDAKTNALLSDGFTFDGQVFSLSVPSQINWTTLHEQQGAFTWPVSVSTKNNNTYELALGDIEAFWVAGRDRVIDVLSSGRALKKLVFDAATESEVDSIIDNR